MERKNNLRLSANWKQKFRLGSASNNNRNNNISNNKFKSRPNSNKLILKKNPFIDNNKKSENEKFLENFLKKDKINILNKNKPKENLRYNNFIKPTGQKNKNNNINFKKNNNKNLFPSINILQNKNNKPVNQNLFSIKNFNINNINIISEIHKKNNLKIHNNNNIKVRSFNVSQENFRYKNIKANNMNNLRISHDNFRPKQYRLQSAGKPSIQIIMNKSSAKGLQNIGATCYMNATLQCLAHVQKLTYHLLSSDIKSKLLQDKRKYRLSSAYLEVCENLWQSKNITYYSPNHFKEVISQMNPLFAGIQANDSKDLILFLLENMHEELNLSKNNVIENNNQMIDQYNFDISFKNFANYFKNNYNSIISGLFYGMFNSIMTCVNCKVVMHNIQCFNILIFPLQKIKEFKMKNVDLVDIYECFEYYVRPDYMGGKTFYCNRCCQMVDNINTTKLLYAPKIIVINLNRGQGLQFKIKINFPEYLDISNFVQFNQNSPTYYELIGIVTHFGPSGMSGHFIAFCKSFGDQQWYKYNDALVSLRSFEEAKNTGVPYILFYSYIKR